jgi:hypothetical protein
MPKPTRKTAARTAKKPAARPVAKARPAAKKTAARRAVARPAKKPVAKAAAKPAARVKPVAKPAAAKPVAKAPAPKAPPAKPDPLALALGSRAAAERVAAAEKAALLGPRASLEVARALVAALEQPDAETRDAALAALRALGTTAQPALAELAARLGEPGPMKKRGALALALARIDSDHLPAALPVLAELVAVGAASEHALLHETLELVPALGLNAVPLLPALLLRLEEATGDEAEAITRAVRSAGPLGAEAVLKATSQAAGPFGAQLVRLLDAHDRPEDTPALGELTRHPDLQIRLAAIQALGRRRTRSVLPELLRALQDPSPEVVGAAQAELQRLAPMEVEPVLAAFLVRLRQDAPEQRNRAVVAASQLGVASFDDVGPLLLDALGDADPAVRAGAAQGLGELAVSARAALPRLRAQRRDASEAVRQAVEATIAAIERSAPR